MLVLLFEMHASNSYSCCLNSAIYFWIENSIKNYKKRSQKKKKKSRGLTPPDPPWAGMNSYIFSRILIDVGLLKLHSWLWIELGFVRSLISVLFDRTRKYSFQFFFICYTWFLYGFSLFQNLWQNPYKSYCRMLLLVHSHFSWKIWTLLYKVVTIFPFFSLEISLIF